jgi:hypothetical protein
VALDSELSRILETLRKRGRKVSDLKGILSLYRTRDIESAVKSILRKRRKKAKGVKSEFENFVESFCVNYCKSTGRLPAIKKVRELSGAYFGIPLTSEGYLPSRFERIVRRVMNRLRVRFWRSKKKEK